MIPLGLSSLALPSYVAERDCPRQNRLFGLDKLAVADLPDPGPRHRRRAYRCRLLRTQLGERFCRSFSTQTGVRAATTAVSARSAASLLALLPVIQPPQDRRRRQLFPVGDESVTRPRELMELAWLLALRSQGRRRTQRAQQRRPVLTVLSRNAVRRLCCRCEGADFDTPLFFAALGQMDVRWTNSTRLLTSAGKGPSQNRCKISV